VALLSDRGAIATGFGEANLSVGELQAIFATANLLRCAGHAAGCLARRTRGGGGSKRSHISAVLPLALLAPDVVEAIVAGRQPLDVPVVWQNQKDALGFL
jgi:hypothetical protein